MAKAIPNPEVSPNGTTHKQLLQGLTEERAMRHLQIPNGSAPHLNNLDFWGEETPSEDGVNGLAAQDQNLLRTLGIGAATRHAASPSPDADALLQENGELRGIIAELKGQLDDAGPKAEEAFRERHKEYEAMLDEKSQIIRELHVKIQELEARPLVPATPKEEELLALSEELERERCQFQQERRQLDEDRKQMEEDEQIMTQQMQEMEVQMARERADFARQRTELNRIQEEIRREVENVERNGLLNQRLGQLRQRSLDVGVPRNGDSDRDGPAGLEGNAAPALTRDQADSRRRESFLGRLFGYCHLRGQ